MEALDTKRARLRYELQQAYSAWMLKSEYWASPGATHESIDSPSSLDSARTKWVEYRAARQRLVSAYAERPVTA